MDTLKTKTKHYTNSIISNMIIYETHSNTMLHTQDNCATTNCVPTYKLQHDTFSHKRIFFQCVRKLKSNFANLRTTINRASKKRCAHSRHT